MELEEYLDNLNSYKASLKFITIDNYLEKAGKMLNQILVDGIKFISSDEITMFQKPLWHIKETQIDEFKYVSTYKTQKARLDAFNTLISYIEQDIDLVINQIEELIKVNSDI